ncbi:MAG: hypothetical protein PHD82_16880 [Candidatus Riflebacteria bacterium]|nr:hypothetical protein [Candidatus Riflebacteria bacterium]
MTTEKSLIKIALVLLWLVMQLSHAGACSLALHDWKLVFFLKIPVSSPVFPLAELNVASLRAKESPVSKIIWMAEHSLPGLMLLQMIGNVADKAASIPWVPVSPGESLLGRARETRKDKTETMLIGSDKMSIKIAFFSDKNSGYNCHQLVVMQNSRIRAVQPDMQVPWAQETIGQSWFSLIFFQIPVPGRIMSFSTYPIRQTRHSIFEDHPLVENLLSKKLLLRRPDLVIDPYIFDFPELPE